MSLVKNKDIRIKELQRLALKYDLGNEGVTQITEAINNLTSMSMLKEFSTINEIMGYMNSLENLKKKKIKELKNFAKEEIVNILIDYLLTDAERDNSRQTILDDLKVKVEAIEAVSTIEELETL